MSGELALAIYVIIVLVGVIAIGYLYQKSNDLDGDSIFYAIVFMLFWPMVFSAMLVYYFFVGLLSFGAFIYDKTHKKKEE